MNTCIYCLEEKPKAKYQKREHVLPQSFGMFRNNFTLIDEVCDDCNQFFGDALERALARDTYEGLLRFAHAIKKPSEYKSAGMHGRIRTNVAEGDVKGAITYREYSDDKNEVVMMLAPDQIGFLIEEYNEKVFYLIDEVPTKEELQSFGVNFSIPGCMYLLECSDEKVAIEKLKMKGIDFKIEGREIGKNDSNTGLFEIHGIIDITIERAIAKIAFNYFCYMYGRENLIVPEFDQIRRFVRYGETVEYPIVNLTEKAILWDEPEDGNRRSGHIITVEKYDNHTLVAKVSLNNMFTYVVILSPLISWNLDSRGHFFNPHDQTIYPLLHLPKE